MKTTDFSNASAAFVDMNQLLNVEKKYADLFRKGRIKPMQKVECEGCKLFSLNAMVGY